MLLQLKQGDVTAAGAGAGLDSRATAAGHRRRVVRLPGPGAPRRRGAGDDVLVAPVVKQGATSRDVYVPAGCWVDANTGLEYAGIEARLEWLPHFFRCGANPFDHDR